MSMIACHVITFGASDNTSEFAIRLVANLLEEFPDIT